MLRLLKFLFIKRTLNFLSFIISYFICHWNDQINCWHFKNLFRPSLSVSFIKCFLFFVILRLSPIINYGVMVLIPNSGYRFLHTLLSFSLRLASFRVILWINELYYYTDQQVNQVHQHIFLNYYEDRAGRIRIANVRQLRRSRRRGHKHRSDLPWRIRATGTAICGAVLASWIRRLAYPKFHSERLGSVSDREPESHINCR